MRRLARILVPLGVILALVATAVILVTAFKLSYYRIETGSMEPSFPVGTVVVTSGNAGYHYGNAISFMTNEGVVTHAYLGHNKDGSLITRGIANASNDSWTKPVFDRDVKGRVMFQILLLAPSFWVSRSGIAVIFGVFLIVLACLWWRRITKLDTLAEQLAATA